MVDGLDALFAENDYVLFSPNPKKSGLKTVSSNSKLWRTHGIVKESCFKELDVFHGLSNELPLAKTTVKKVVTIHDVIFKRRPELYGFFDRWIYDFKTKRACKNANKIVAISEFTKRDLVEFYNVSGDKIEVVYQDCHPQFYTTETPKINLQKKYALPSEYILCVGTIEKRKSQLTLIKALEKSNENLVLIGKKTSYWVEIEAYLVLKPQLKERVTVIDDAVFKDFPQIYREAKLFVYPSTLEGFGIPVIEALNSGTAVITTKDTVMEEACGGAGLLFEAGNYLDLRSKIDTLLKDEALKSTLIKKGKEQVLKFRKEKTLSTLNNIYKSL